MKAKKSLGQNFLRSKQVVSLMVETGKVEKGDVVLEIGPGEGVMTEELLSKGFKVIAVEKDSRLISFLQEKFERDVSNRMLEVVEADILEFDISSLPAEYKVIANIPYYITGQILRTFLENKNKPVSMTLLVQKEVAERIVAKNGKESILSISVKIFGKPKYIKTVSRGVFVPQPSVDSAILHIDNISKLKDVNEGIFFKILKIGFAHKRKKLLANLSEFYDRGLVQNVFSDCKIDPNARAEELSPEKWLELHNKLR
ncbi:MAG: 16S rRNA (adenine(1518)-N(6)/adenine(1519)-N(6))-dimethyltransferase RsmA [Minisyncoccia bacterium]